MSVTDALARLFALTNDVHIRRISDDAVACWWGDGTSTYTGDPAGQYVTAPTMEDAIRRALHKAEKE